MQKEKNAFTIIELIFVIVILGILATIAIPKLMMTRDDARVSKLAHLINNVKSELISGMTSSTVIPQNREEIEAISNTLSGSYPDFSITVVNGKTIQFINMDNDTEICKILKINDTNTSQVRLDISDGNGTSAVCTGVQALIPNTNSGFMLSGNAVTY